MFCLGNPCNSGTLVVASTVGSLIVLSMSGPALYNAFEGMLWEATSLLWGGILALSYFSPLAHEFTAVKPPPDARP